MPADLRQDPRAKFRRDGKDDGGDAVAGSGVTGARPSAGRKEEPVT